MLKKIYRISAKFLYFSFFYFISPFVKVFKLEIYPDLGKINFFNSYNHINNLPNVKKEIAIVGSSNVGKSSLLNYCFNNDNLSFVSK